MRWIRYYWSWWRWMFSAPYIGDFYLCGRYQKQAFRVATQRWCAREPKRPLARSEGAGTD